jgi:hypothetical protein
VTAYMSYRFLLPVAALLITATRPAVAGSGLVVVGGAAQDHDRMIVSDAIEKAVRGAGWTLSAKLSKKDADGLLNCKDAQTPWTCVPSAVARQGIKDVLVVSVDASQAPNGAPLVVITARLISTTPQAFAFTQRYCDHCADDRLGESGAEVAGQLIQELATRTSKTVVRFHSEPGEAELILDGTKLGVTEATYDTAPGKHTVVFQKNGYISELRQFVAEAGKTADVAVTLRSSEPSPSSASSSGGAPTAEPQHARSLLLPAVAIGVGGALALGGGALVIRGQETDGGKYEYSRATSLGLATGIVGLAAVGAGIYLMLRDDKPDRKLSAPAAAVGPDRVVVQWIGEF